MIATADSNVNSKICLIIISESKDMARAGPVLARRVNKRCPATMFAISRTAKVPGRMMFLVISIQTINGIRGPGVPAGRRWANMCWVLLIKGEGQELM